MSVVILSNGYYPDPDIGKPIANGYIYVGIVDTDPTVTANQKTLSVLQEDGSEVAVAQPIRTSAGGVPVYNGSPVTLIAASPYSLLVQDSDEAQKIYSPSNTGSSQANEDWSEEGAAVAFDSASTFIVDGDVTAVYVAHRAVQLTQTSDDTGFVVSSSYAAGPDETTVTVRVATVDSGLSTVEYGQEVTSSPGGSDSPFHADTVGDHIGQIQADDLTMVLDPGADGSAVILNAGEISGTAIKDEDNMASDSATHLVTQQSVKAYVDAAGIVQKVTVEDGTAASGTTAFPFDATTPQITEGDEYLTVAITPTNAANTIMVEAVTFFAASSAATIGIGFFNTDVHATNAVSTGAGYSSAADEIECIVTKYEALASALNGTTETTFTLRAGIAPGATTYFNSNSSVSPIYNGTLSSRITIYEIEAARVI